MQITRPVRLKWLVLFLIVLTSIADQNTAVEVFVRAAETLQFKSCLTDRIRTPYIGLKLACSRTHGWKYHWNEKNVTCPWKDSPHQPRFQARSSPLPRIGKWSTSRQRKFLLNVNSEFFFSCLSLVIRSPHLYPPSRRTSLTLDISESRRSSGSSAFSLSVHSPRLIHHLRVVPTGLSDDNLSQHREIQLRGSQEEDNEEPPPPYPGKRTSRDASSTDYIWLASQRSTRPDTRTHDYDTTGETGSRSSGERGSAIRSNQEHHDMRPNRAHVVNAWIDSEAVNRISRGKTNSELCRPNIYQLRNPEDRNLDVNGRDRSFLRTFVSHSLQGTSGVVSTTHSLPSVNAEFTEAV